MTNRHRAVCMVFLLIVVFALLVVTGCPRSASPVGPPPSATTLPTITAYINVSSGCQKPTVNALKAAREVFDALLTIEIIDFGDSAAGTRMWKDSGLECMAILFEGNRLVAWEQDGEVKVVDFTMPPGFNWTIQDLDSAINAFAEGRLRQPTSEEQSNVQQLTPEPVRATAQSTTGDDGVEVGQLIITGTLAIEIACPLGDLTPLQRAAAAAKAVAEWTGQPYKPSDLQVQKAAGDLQVVAGDIPIITVTQDDADAAKTNPEALAARWHNGIRSSVTSALGKPAAPPLED